MLTTILRRYAGAWQLAVAFRKRFSKVNKTINMLTFDTGCSCCMAECYVQLRLGFTCVLVLCSCMTYHGNATMSVADMCHLPGV